MISKRDPKVMRGNKLMISVTIDPDQVAAVDEIADLRRTSRAQLFREALAYWLKKQRHADDQDDAA